ncbi:bifunctional ornithine acetyltransferase/N-acetylglutamate synthase [Solemya pervernicosa gill symbiont]|uniref:Arginine biosynthesis bifunctional protein ArgJ n=2 Tax=Gammaproteobacteria incertae sedis TaxID=118884 RepID=A0A1T2L9Q4_9GAMM|nr:bifunctional glutamate N-acetyltransferase/amino-acid acetyltransferase ArgJ [Candidatus Reidiella endopervernicosa]OOZ41839.1 bifunctional ornithine acetyltransferase/N-acetylglutamate synthase [Solemya pervernicosa gill symbiont]QKQ26211.1 bifunctional glutamate N-acetyltransferase/amino-acid acetyltransferase ArgJ [Candidatus Reidiella endopervernicosa]
MAVGLKPIAEMHPVAGFRLGTTSAGIKTPGRRDVVLMELPESASCAAVFTRNAFCAAPVTIAKQHLAHVTPRYLLINTGNANAGTGAQGIADAQRCCRAVAEQMGVAAETVLPFSTGVIGEPLPAEKIIAAIPVAAAALELTAWGDAAHGILTTDTMAKGSSRRVSIDGGEITVTGISKGSGMIRPDMATMLAYVATDAAVESELLQQLLEEAVANSFNAITVDGDTSTNDACVLVATAASRIAKIESEMSVGYAELREALIEVCQELAQAIIRDGEGATKFITVEVTAGESVEECRQVAYTIAHSPLVKTAFFASDPNWGRILAAVGRAGVDSLDLEAVTIHLDEVCIVRAGCRVEEYQESAGQVVMDREEITINVALARGHAAATVWTSDLSHEYVKINAEYRT